MKWLATIILITLISIAIFGVAVVGHGANHDMDASKNDCITSRIINTKCPDVKDLVGIVTHHVNALQALSQGLVAFGLTVSLAVLILALPVALVFMSAKMLSLLRNLALQHQRFRLPKDYIPPKQHKLIHWLSLFELSPAPVSST